MSNKFYTPGPERAANVADLFARIAPKYDFINDLQSFGLHRHWKSTLVQMAAAQKGKRALDVCCGTGDIALALFRHGAEVIGLDFSPAMLQIAQRRLDKARTDPETSSRIIGERAPISTLTFTQGDALDLPFSDDSFDIVTVGYGLRNLASWEKGMEQMWRVTRPGGRILVLDFGKPDNPLWRGIYNTYLKVFVPIFGKLFCKDSATHAYIYASLRTYPAQRGVAAKLSSLGCRSVAIKNLAGGAMSINFALKA